MSKYRTRHKSENNLTRLVGTGKDLIISELPTLRSAIQLGILLKEEKFQALENIFGEVAKRIIEQWGKANAKLKQPVILHERSVKKKFEKFLYMAIRVAKDKAKIGEKSLLHENLDKLFNITTCKHEIYKCKEKNSGCNSPDKCEKKVHIECSCPLEEKIPQGHLQI